MNIMLQRAIFELLAPAGPTVATVLSGFGIFVGGQMYLTPAGEAYLKLIEEDGMPESVDSLIAGMIRAIT